ncbi:MAG: DciA family protein [Methylococcaceae bacterium]
MNTFKEPLGHKNRTMSLLEGKIIEQKKLLRCVQSALPEGFAQQARHCVLKDELLLVYVDSSAWASKLRFLTHVILTAVSVLAPQVTKVDIRLMSQVMGVTTATPSRKANLPSINTIETLHKDSLAIKDEELKSALLSLSETLARLSKKA